MSIGTTFNSAVRILTRLFIGATTLYIFIAIMALAQAAQLYNSLQDARENAVNNWSEGNNRRIDLVREYKAECNNKSHVVISNIEVPNFAYSISECANEHNLTEILSVIKVAEMQFRNVAWPLSSFIGVLGETQFSTRTTTNH